MYDAGKILTGLVVFVAFVGFPIWYNHGVAAPAPKPKLPETEKQCVESKEFMRTSHMQLLNEWRDTVVREGNRVYVGTRGKKYNMSLQNTCMKCHAKKSEFCDKCHQYATVKPYCWDCHFVPKEKL
ncbi:cytochrome C [Dissulfurirhabdus thermomarina]|uniref:Cytochrome C n=1 Tax=Dissulfurirhabdus thermomarina TaxID=1765737 RepID=A0A6N9TPP9_DISTH|nr:sulfate reduction electron transfer complex DsrMKJOP subunit DsrJ [Dissulfurirhabdus thermomarina]NDY43139.1 cytochrome C [Dissulfurirhabdus thermomarina]NMX23993.1 sulfate reduction electron transfer complex DsrMKJOP subunit DsrJ [Dissulfurirhabdus thermomarina]